MHWLSLTVLHLVWKDLLIMKCHCWSYEHVSQKATVWKSVSCFYVTSSNMHRYYLCIKNSYIYIYIYIHVQIPYYLICPLTINCYQMLADKCHQSVTVKHLESLAVNCHQSLAVEHLESLAVNCHQCLTVECHQSLAVECHQSLAVKCHQSLAVQCHQCLAVKYHQGLAVECHQSLAVKCHQSLAVKCHQSLAVNCLQSLAVKCHQSLSVTVVNVTKAWQLSVIKAWQLSFIKAWQLSVFKARRLQPPKSIFAKVPVWHLQPSSHAPWYNVWICFGVYWFICACWQVFMSKLSYKICLEEWETSDDIASQTFHRRANHVQSACYQIINCIPVLTCACTSCLLCLLRKKQKVRPYSKV